MTAVAARPSPTVHTVRRLGAALLQLARWFWLIAVVAVVAANVVGWATRGSTDVLIAPYARQASTWFPFSLAAMLVTAYLRVHVASGMTRRSFVRAAVVVQVAAGVAYALVLTALVLVERAVHDALGWRATITEVMVVGASAPTWAMLVDVAVPCVVGNLTGLLVGVAYLRGGSWWGTLTLPLTVGPLAFLLYAPGARLLGFPGPWTDVSDGQALVSFVAVGVVAALAVALVFAAVARRVPVGSKP